jgi:hypothetical protein
MHQIPWDGYRPLLLLDVDGVLNPYAAPTRPAGALEVPLFGETVWLVPQHGIWLRELLAEVQIIWATGWEDDANRIIAPLLGLPAFPVIHFPRNPAGRFVKLATVQDVVGNAPIAWLDDELTPAAFQWAAERRAPTRLIPVDPAHGVQVEHIAQVRAFAAEEAAR